MKRNKFIIFIGILIIPLLFIFKGMLEYKKIDKIKEVQVSKVNQGKIISTISAVGKIATLDFYQVKDLESDMLTIRPLNITGTETLSTGDTICILSNPERKKLILTLNQQFQLALLEFNTAWQRVKDAKRSYQRNLKIASLELKRAEEQYTKTKKIYEAGGIPKQQVIETENSYIRAKLQYETTKEESSINDSKMQFEKAKIQLQTARDELKSLITELKKENIPYELLGTTSLVVETQVDEFDIRKINLKQPTRIIGRSIPSELAGDILKIGDKVIEDTKAPYIKVISSIKPPSNAQLKPGLQVEVEITTNCKENILCIPLSAILEKDEKKVVYVVEGNKAIMKQIEVGVGGVEMVEVIKGLKEGDLVVSLGNLDLKDGELVKIQ